MKNNYTIIVITIIALLFFSCVLNNSSSNTGSSNNDVDSLLSSNGLTIENVINTIQSTEPKNLPKGVTAKCLRNIELVQIGGRVNHFGLDITVDPPEYIPFEQNVENVNIWVAEYPETKNLGLTSDSNGEWKAWVLKYVDQDIKFSFIYEKEGWITTKSNEITISSEDDLSIHIQYVDPFYYTYGAKPTLEAALAKALGQEIPINNAMVVTVGKDWATMDVGSDLPHGDPEAIALINEQFSLFPDVIGPIYFDETVTPNPLLENTSVDGGVLFINITLGTYDITALKTGVNYETVTFQVTQDDIDNGVELFIASPPHSVQGDNTSPPGEN